MPDSHEYPSRLVGLRHTCPSYHITHDAAHSTSTRVKAFKAALNGELGDDPFAHPDLAAAMDLCVSCKGCKKECPSAVDMTLINTIVGLEPSCLLAHGHCHQKAFGAMKSVRKVLGWIPDFEFEIIDADGISCRQQIADG